MASSELRRNRGGLIDLVGRVVSVFQAARTAAGAIDDIVALAPLLRDFFNIEEPWHDPVGLKARIVVCVKACRILAAMTETTTDDDLVEQAGRLADNDALIGLMASLLKRFFAENPSGTPEQFLAFVQSGPVRESIVEAATERQISLGTIVEAFKLLLALYNLFRDATSTPAGTGTPASGTPSPAPGGGLFNF